MIDKIKSKTPDNITIWNIVGILALFCTMSEFTIMTPSIAAFSHHFAGTDITTIMFANTITGILSVPVSIGVGAILHKTGFKPAGIIGILIMSLGGAFPFLLPDITDYTVVIASRIIVGIGLGIMFPVGNATIIAFFDKEKRSKLLGLGITVQFSFAIVYSTAAGFLTEIGWNYSFLAYLIGLVPLIFVILFMPEAKPFMAKEADRRNKANKTKVKDKIPTSIYGFALFGLVAWIVYVSITMICSTILDERGLADAGVAALVINCCGLGTILCGLIFPYLVRIFKERLFGVSALVLALGIIPCFLATNVAMYAIGNFFIGIGGSAFFTAAQNSCGNLAPKSRVPFVSGIMTSMMNLAPFLTPYILVASAVAMPALGNSAMFVTCLIFAGVLTLIGLVHPMKSLTMKPDEETENAVAQE